MALDDDDKQHFRDLLTNFRASRNAVQLGADYGDKGGPGEQQHNNRVAVYEANAASLRHFLVEKAEEGVGDDELRKAATLTPTQLADLRRDLA